MQQLDRIPAAPPRIAPLPSGIDRPLWSVMIPAYNCFPYLGEAIRSVLEQYPGPALMQVEVVDDASTDGDLAQLVRDIGKGRVAYFRQSENRGSLRNFETCLNRARGHIVHLLHGDDAVKPGFYAAMQRLMEAHPGAGAAFCTSDYIDARGKVLGATPSLQPGEGLLENWLTRIATHNLLQTPSMVVRREVYESLGGFFAVHFGEDWEMWCRIAAHYPVAYTPESLASYRVHTSNITNASLQTSSGIGDIQKVIGIIRNYLPEADRERISQLARRNYAIHFAGQALRFHQNSPGDYLHLAWNAFRMYPGKATLKFLLMVWMKQVKAKVG